ncbi:hypothetical protein SAMN05216327_10399 [Dyadobacter sp. SG02]|nr:hypothetical protein SAMN05216327_10399 [Dyadobacter sp. SG02]
MFATNVTVRCTLSTNLAVLCTVIDKVQRTVRFVVVETAMIVDTKYL